MAVAIGIRIRFFARLREQAGVESEGIEVAPDSTLTDVYAALRGKHSALPELGCLMLTSFADDDALFDAIMAGASGYVLKQVRGNDLVNAVRTVTGT